MNRLALSYAISRTYLSNKLCASWVVKNQCSNPLKVSNDVHVALRSNISPSATQFVKMEAQKSH